MALLKGTARPSVLIYDGDCTRSSDGNACRLMASARPTTARADVALVQSDGGKHETISQGVVRAALRLAR